VLDLGRELNVVRSRRRAFLDPHPEVQRAACDLVETLARLCPVAVRMNAMSLLAPLTGRRGGARGDALGVDAGKPNVLSRATSKKCMFHHRHAKTRCRAVSASAAIVMCCPREEVSSPSDDGDGGMNEDNADAAATSAEDRLSNYGSRCSAPMQRVLQDALLLRKEGIC